MGRVLPELDSGNETVGQGGALPLESADGAGAGHEADTEEAQRSVQSEGGVSGGPYDRTVTAARRRWRQHRRSRPSRQRACASLDIGS